VRSVKMMPPLYKTLITAPRHSDIDESFREKRKKR
jgi:hypothetical protein